MGKTQNKNLREVLKKPVRVRILGWLAGKTKPQTKSEIGKALSLSNASMHYHMKLLEKAGVVKFEGTRPGPNSIMEKLYSAKPVPFNQEKFMNDKEKSEFYLKYTMDSIHEIHREAEELIKSDWKANRFIVGCYGTYASEQEIKDFKKHLTKIIEEFHEKHKKPTTNRKALAITFGLLPSKAAAWESTQKVFDMIS